MTKIFRHPQKFPWKSDWKTDTLLIFDRVLLKHPATAAWLRRFPVRYPVRAGEGLKDLRAFPDHLEAIARLSSGMASRKMRIVVVGGGSVGDFGGFVASVFKRGVQLVQIPSTWLAALDSAHGGKNGLNLRGAKNQIGTIYEASEIHLVKKLLCLQPRARAFEAAGEALKISLLKGGRFSKIAWQPESTSNESLWKELPLVIEGKMSIVRRDPLEKSGLRHLLNLGHTLGHVFEAALGLPHGLAVAYGLVFAVSFSRAQGICSEQSYEKMISHPLWGLYVPSDLYRRCLQVPPRQLESLLLQDKKRSGRQTLRFVFLKSIGRPLIRDVKVSALVAEVQRQRRLLRGLHG